ELLPRFLINVWGPQHAILVFHRGQRNWSSYLGAGAPRCFYDLARGLIQDAVIVSLQSNTNSLSNHARLSKILRCLIPAVKFLQLPANSGGFQRMPTCAFPDPCNPRNPR